MPAITMIKALDATKRSTFIELGHQYIKDKIKKNDIKVKHTPSEELKADVLTKQMGRVKFTKLRNMIAVEHIPDTEKIIMATGD